MYFSNYIQLYLYIWRVIIDLLFMYVCMLSCVVIFCYIIMYYSSNKVIYYYIQICYDVLTTNHVNHASCGDSDSNTGLTEQYADVVHCSLLFASAM